MKRILLTLALGLGLLTANAQIEKLAGPRLGLTFISAGPIADFLHDGFEGTYLLAVCVLPYKVHPLKKYHALELRNYS